MTTPKKKIEVKLEAPVAEPVEVDEDVLTIEPDPRIFMMLRAGDLTIDQRVQREVRSIKVAAIATKFDWSLFECLTITVDAKGRYHVIEGQHRCLAVQSVNPDVMVPCMVLSEQASSTQQAEIALDITKGRGSHTAYEKWRLNYNSGHAYEVMGQTVLDELGLRVGPSTSAHVIGAVRQVSRIVHAPRRTPEEGAEVLRRVLSVLQNAYPTTNDAHQNSSRWAASLLISVSNIILANEEVNDERLTRSLAQRPAVQWVNIGRSAHSSTWREVQMQITQEYNRNLRQNRLELP